MTYVITDGCTKDYQCVSVCPTDAIHEDGRDGKQLIINPDDCSDCGACLAECPVEAIFAIEDLPESKSAAAEFNAAPFRSEPHPPVAVAPA